MDANKHPAQTASRFTNEELVDSQTTQHDDNVVTKGMLISENAAADIAASTMADAHKVGQYKAGMAALSASQGTARTINMQLTDQDLPNEAPADSAGIFHTRWVNASNRHQTCHQCQPSI